MSVLPDQPQAPAPARRTPAEEADLTDHHHDEYESGLDEVPSGSQERARERSQRSLEAAMVFASGMAAAGNLGDIL